MRLQENFPAQGFFPLLWRIGCSMLLMMRHFKQPSHQLAEQSHIGQITDVYGYNHPQSARVSYPVHDLMLSAKIEHVMVTASFTFV
ncbi:MAG: hypothetical protein R3C02_05730 [Planctomycetaceae bacterium]